MSDHVVQVRSLSIRSAAGAHLLDAVDLAVAPGEVVGLAGTSGSGKTTLARALLGDVRPGLERTGGSVVVAGHDPFRPRGRDALRGRRVTYLGQDPAAGLNPARRVGDLVGELVRLRTGAARGEVHTRVHALFDLVGLPTDRGFLRRRPHEVSGGQAQRVALASALAGDPDLLVLDEPTSGLDPVLVDRVGRLVAGRVRGGDGRAALVVSHDARFLASTADRVVHLERGRVVPAPAVPRPVAAERVSASSEQVLRVVVTAGHGRGPVLDGAELSVAAGECVAVTGPSGSGKSTFLRALAGLHPDARGTLHLAGRPLPWPAGRRGPDRRAVALVAQDSASALNPRESVRTSLSRPLRGLDPRAVEQEVARLLERVRLSPDVLDRRSPQLSGGQRQRVNLARALAAGPRVLLCDEVTSALDERTASAVLDLLAGLRADLGLAVVLVTHDLEVARRSADRVLRVHEGRFAPC
ncbi:ABC transporter ATP-binding protein [Kineococcus sp. TBRC 1896]|uniref:ABC transporter ATP-binding protein n=1 Tax=Kineococcus mangrovi TaxID=1660183 RepID=A0ABV4I0Q5_9ACTN